MESRYKIGVDLGKVLGFKESDKTCMSVAELKDGEYHVIGMFDNVEHAEEFLKALKQ